MGKNPRSIYVIYTGGTLGMKYGADGSLAPEPEYLTQQIRTLPDFSSDQMPQITVNEWNPIWDSSDISHDQWERLAREIESVYYDYDGFVVLHGTDTMAYTASALSFMLENLGKPVIITGSSIPFCDVYNDARRNVVVTFMYASLADLCEVCIFFNNHLLRGNRSTKFSIRDLAAFESQNFPPLGVLGVHMSLKKEKLLPPPKQRFRIFTKLCRDIVYLKLIPGCSDDILRNACLPPTKGVILETFGAGNAPNRESLYQALSEASSRGCVIVILSQCQIGWVDFGEYKAGGVMRNAGAVSGIDMTAEACATKLAYLLGKGLPVDEVRRLMEADLRGELTPAGQRGTLTASLEYFK